MRVSVCVCERGKTRMSSSICPFCQQSVPTPQLERHANNHFDDEEFARDVERAKAISLSSMIPSDIPVDDVMLCESNFWRVVESSTSNSKERHCGRGSDIDGKIQSLVSVQIREVHFKVKDGIIALLRKCLEMESENSTCILSGYVDHFQSMESVDAGWGCGWRNIQMLSSHLLMQRQEAREVLFGGVGFVPDIASLQRWLEIAWERGFDTLGSKDFDQKIYGKKNWIGTTECAALLRSFGLRARIVDFSCKPTSSVTVSSKEVGDAGLVIGKRNSNVIIGPMDRFLLRGNNNIVNQAGCSVNVMDKYPSNHAQKVKGQQLLADWVWSYFSENSLDKSCHKRVVVSGKGPLYFQHDGHSRTIVGIQVKGQQNGARQYNLLILDPGHKTDVLERSLSKNFGWQKFLKRGIHTLKKPEYQLCHIDPGIATDAEMEMLKTLDSTRFDF